MIDTSKMVLEFIKPDNNTRRSCPMISVGHNRFEMNKELSNELNLSKSHRFVEVSNGDYENNIVVLFRFLKERTANTYNAVMEENGRILISNKTLTTTLFGTKAAGSMQRLDNIEIDSEKKLVLLKL